MEFVFIVLLGLSLGSFFNVLVYRIPRKINLIMPFSFCPKCQKSLKWFDKIPVVSYFMNFGKCRFCHQRIPFWYCLGEILGGVFAFFSFYCFGILGVVCLLLLLNFYALSVIDWQFFEIPDSLNFINLGLAIVFGGLFGELELFLNTWLEALVGAFLMMGVASFLRLFVGGVLQKEVLGEGDIVVFGALGASLGVFGGIFAVMVGSCCALLCMLINRKKMLPFVPFLFLGFLVAFCVKFGNFLFQFV